MYHPKPGFLLTVVSLLTAIPLWAEPRTIVINEDRAQHFMTSKTYELKYAQTHDLMPFVLGTFLRFDAQFDVQSLDYTTGGKLILLVSSVSSWLPYKVDENGSVIDGDGISRWGYCPDYRLTAVWWLRALPAVMALAPVISMYFTLRVRNHRGKPI